MYIPTQFQNNMVSITNEKTVKGKIFACGEIQSMLRKKEVDRFDQLIVYYPWRGKVFAGTK